MKALAGSLFLAVALAGCSDAGDAGGKDEGLPAEAGEKDLFNTGGYKADCYGCAPDGANAFAQLGLRDRFWKVGDHWQVAYQMRTDTRVQMQALQFLEPTKADVGLVVLDFKVVANGKASIGGVERDTATIQITQGEARGNLSVLLTEDKLIRVDEVTEKLELVLDDLLRPVSVTEYSGPRGAFPNGQLIQMDPRQALRSTGSSFPYVVPNAYLNASKTSLPELPEELAEIAARVRPDYAQRSYHHFDLKGYGAESAEQVYWAEGEPWPFLVETPYATGVLVTHN